jgi:hypothetical protein
VVNYGTIDATRALVMEYGGVNTGTIVVQDVDQGQITLRGTSPTQAREWDLAPTSQILARRVALTANARVAGTISGDLLTVSAGFPIRTDTIAASALDVDSLMVTAKVWVVGEGTHSLVRTTVQVTGAELWLVDDPTPSAPLVLDTRRFVLGAGGLVGGGLVDADSLQLLGNNMVLAGRMRLGTYGIMNMGSLTGRSASFEIAGELDLNPSSAATTLQIVTESPTVGADLVILNNGTIRKRGLGTAQVRACFDPDGSGSIVTDGGANPPTIEPLACP